MKKFYLIQLLFLSFFVNAEVAYKIDLVNEEHFAGEVIEIMLQSTSKIKIGELPEADGLQWLETTYTQENHRSSGKSTTVYISKMQFFTDNPGPVYVPVIEARIGDETILLPSRTVNMQPARNQSDCFLRLLYNGKKQPGSYVVGQSVDIELLVFRSAGSKAYINIPSVELQNTKLHNYMKVSSPFARNKRSIFYNNFSSGIFQDSRDKTMNGKKWDIRRFKIKADLLRSGRVHGKVLCIINENGYRFPLLGEIDFQVKSVPSYKGEDAFETELTGEWKISSEYSDKEMSVNKPFTYTINFEGSGDLKRLKIPQFKYPGIKVVSRSFEQDEYLVDQWRGKVKYILMPTEKAHVMPPVKLAYFNSETKSYEVVEVSEKIPVKGGISAEQAVNLVKEEVPLAPQEKVMGDDLRRPAYLNLPSWLVLPVFLLPVIFLCLNWFKLPGSDVVSKEARRLRKRHMALVKKINAHIDESCVMGLVEAELLPFLQDLYNLPPGATAQDMIPYIEDEELKEILVKVSESSFSPEKLEVCPRILVKSVRHMALLIFIFFIPFAMALEESANVFSQANKAFELKDYKEAVRLYNRQLEENPNNKELHYNLGNAYYKDGQYNRARASYYTALMLDPGHQPSQKNLKILNDKTNYSGPLRNPLNILRPDQWLLPLLCLWCSVWLILIVLKKKKKRFFEVAAGGFTIVALLAAIVVYQVNVSYSKDRYMVVAKAAPCYQKPGTINRELNKISAGTEFIVLKKSGQFALVNSAGHTFWLNLNDMQKIW